MRAASYVEVCLAKLDQVERKRVISMGLLYHVRPVGFEPTTYRV